MGLAEKRATEAYKGKQFAVFLTSLKETLGYEVPVEVEWDKLGQALEGRSDLEATLDDFFKNLYGEPILQALKSVCADQMGKDAIKGQLKKIHMTSGPDGSSWDQGFTFENGTLSLNMVYSNTHETPERIKGMQALLESKL